MSNRNYKANILLVDDNEHNLTTLQVVLKDLEQNLVFARSGEEALKRCLQYDFAVILMDAQLPDISGFEVVRLLRCREKNKHTPIIFVTAFFKNEMDILQGYSLGAVDYIVKPFSPEILFSKVKTFTDLVSKSAQNMLMRKELEKRQKLTRQYKQLAQQTQLILSSVGEGICKLDADGRIIYANDAASVLLEVPRRELIGQRLYSFMNSSLHQKKILQEVILGVQANYSEETIFYKKSQQKIAVEYTINHIEEKRNKLKGAVIIFKDISEKRRAEELVRKHQQQLELAQVARISTMKEVASAMAHELTQPLAIISNYIKGCLHRFSQKDISHEEIVMIMERTVKQSERAGTIIHRIKDLVQQERLYFEKSNLNELINETLEVIESEIQVSKVKLISYLDEKLPTIYLDKIQIQQVLLNLFKNSMDALGEKKIKKPEIEIYTKMKDSNAVEVTVSDNGPGFDPNIEHRLFDIYFTTKKEGMGMGLAICRTIIEAHGGSLSAHINGKGGADFQFILPFNSEKNL